MPDDRFVPFEYGDLPTLADQEDRDGIDVQRGEERLCVGVMYGDGVISDVVFSKICFDLFAV